MRRSGTGRKSLAILNSLCTLAYTCAVLSPAETARIRAEIERLEKLRAECADTGIRQLIEDWIEAEKEKLKSDEKSTLKIEER